MGNKIGRRRQAVDEKYTKPQGQLRDIDQRKLRRLILESKLAPCYPGDEEYALDLEECPICFLYYPSLNRSRCCVKGICTECFLQMKPPNQSRAAQCPFCKTANYAVEYRGLKTKDEKCTEEIEEQKVIEAQIRIRQQELQDEAAKLKKPQNISSSGRVIDLEEVEYHDMCNTSFSGQSNDFISSQVSCSAQASRWSSHSRQNRDDDFDLDLEDIMIMEAIWLSLQEQGFQENLACSGSLLPGPSYPVECHNSEGITPKISSFGGLSYAAAALAECQYMNGSKAPVYNVSEQPRIVPAGNAKFVQQNLPPDCWVEISQDEGREVVREQFGGRSTDHWSEVTEAGTSCDGSDIAVDTGPTVLPFLERINVSSGNYVPDSFEDQMMLAMALSLAEARDRMNKQGFSWP